MVRGGLAGNGGMYFLVLSALAVILMGLRSGVVMAGLSLLAFAALTAAARLGWMSDWLIYHENPLSLEAWVAAGSVLVMLLVALVGMQWLFSRFLLDTLKEARQAAGALSATHSAMRRQTRQLETANRLLEKRAAALAAAAEVSRAANSVLEPEALIRQTVNLIADRFDYYYAGLFLLDADGRWAELKAGTGEAGRQMLAQNHRLEVGGDSMIGRCTAHGQARVALHVGKEAVRFENPLLPETRSEMALPLISRGQVIGAVSVQSTEPQAFSDEDVAVLQTMADQVANAIENARLLQETERLARRNRLISEVTGKLRGALGLEELLQTTVRELGLALDASEAVVRLAPSTSPAQAGGDGRGNGGEGSQSGSEGASR
jgi:GAF domain-containing protein